VDTNFICECGLHRSPEELTVIESALSLGGRVQQRLFNLVNEERTVWLVDSSITVTDKTTLI